MANQALEQGHAHRLVTLQMQYLRALQQQRQARESWLAASADDPSMSTLRAAYAEATRSLQVAQRAWTDCSEGQA